MNNKLKEELLERFNVENAIDKRPYYNSYWIERKDYICKSAKTCEECALFAKVNARCMKWLTNILGCEPVFIYGVEAIYWTIENDKVAREQLKKLYNFVKENM